MVTHNLPGIGGPGKLRGSFWFVLGVLSLVLFDNDLNKAAEHPEGQQHHGISHLLYYLLAWTGLSDHEVLSIYVYICFLFKLLWNFCSKCLLHIFLVPDIHLQRHKAERSLKEWHWDYTYSEASTALLPFLHKRTYCTKLI